MPTNEEPANTWRGLLVVALVVAVFLGGLAAWIGPAQWRIRGPTRRADVARSVMDNISQAIIMYKLDEKKLPDTLEELTQPDKTSGEAYMASVPQDPWGNEYEYRRVGRNQYRIRSAGDDGALGTDDDIAVDSDKWNGER